MIPELIEFGQAVELPKCGIGYPSTKHQVEWMFRRRTENGLADAFTVVNGRNLFKPRRYLELASGNSEAPPRAPVAQQARRPAKTRRRSRAC